VLLAHVLDLGAAHPPEAGHGGEEAVGVVGVDVPLDEPLGPHHEERVAKGGDDLADLLNRDLDPLHQELGAVAVLVLLEGLLGVALDLGGLGEGPFFEVAEDALEKAQIPHAPGVHHPGGL